MEAGTLGRRCQARSSRSGAPCQRWAIAGGTVCATHGGSAPQVRQRAQERLLQAVDPVAAELVRIALEGESEADRLRACQAVLDRAGLPKAERLQLDARTELVQERQRLLALMFPDEREGEPEPEEAEGEARIAPVDAERNGEVEPTEL